LFYGPFAQKSNLRQIRKLRMIRGPIGLTVRQDACTTSESIGKEASTMQIPAAWKRSWGVLAFAALLAVGCNKGESNPGVTATVPGPTETTRNPQAGETRVPEEPHRPVVQIDTTLGMLTVELDADRAPVTVKNFLWYASNGTYQQTIFHQVLPGYVAIAGGYDPTGQPRPTHIEIRNESGNGLKNKRGSIAMARRPDVIDSSTSQFFINLADNSHLDQKGTNSAEEFGYCVFGQVIDGMEVLDRISAAEVTDKEGFPSTPASPIVVKSISRVK
jgi:cyclophilin family peptidyl-prolyl cis-trans isomerase